MTQEEIRKLLGGYATDTLAERERTALFEAALEDQDLFNALQNEDALRELLADPVTRQQARHALQREAAKLRKTTLAFRLRPGLIGAAGVAAAAIVAMGIVRWHREPVQQAVTLRDQVAQPQLEPKPAAPQPAAAIAAPARRHAARPMAPLPSVAANPPLYSGPLVRYSVLRSGPSGGAVRIEVVSQVAGSLTLYREDGAGRWERVFPASGPGLSIAANAPYQIPDEPIAVRGNRKKLRLVVEPAARAGVMAQLAAGALNEPRGQAVPSTMAMPRAMAAPRAMAGPKTATAPAPPGPLVIEIPIGPN